MGLPNSPVYAKGSAHFAQCEAGPFVLEAASILYAHRRAYLTCKRTFDILFSLLVLVFLSPLFFAIALAIKLDDPAGPVLFCQERVGKDGRRFCMYKFRSMVVGAEEELAGLVDMNEKAGPVFKMRDDPRVTRIGRVLRRHSLDELPQFVNVLKGDMSVVGPRPALPREVVDYTPWQAQRLFVTPGLTCYWQASRHRDEIPFDEWVAMDLAYIERCSVLVDLKLIAKTVGAVLTAQGS